MLTTTRPESITSFLARERGNIEAEQRHLLRHGRIDNQADMRTFCRLEGRLEQVMVVEAWLAATTFVEVER